MFYLKAVALSTKRENDYTDKDGVVHESHVIVVVDDGGYPLRINSRKQPTIEANTEYMFPVLLFPKISKKGNATNYIVLKDDMEIKKIS